MARGPYQGNFQPNFHPTVVHSPDAIVYINGEADLISCPVCKKKFDLSKYITSVSVDLNVESAPGSATINLSIPRHIIDDFFFDGVPVISPMMEVEIYAKGYYLVEGLPQYYPIFWGLTTEVSDSYSGGEHTVSIQCNDILKWWELCKMNINPAFTGQTGVLGKNLQGNVFHGMNPYDIIYTLAYQSFGDICVGTGSFVTPIKGEAQTQTFSAALQDITAYWQSRFGRIRSNLMLYGVNGTVIRGATLFEKYDSGSASLGKSVAARAIADASDKGGGQPVFDPSSPLVTAFRTQMMNTGQMTFFQSEMQTKLELANAAKDSIGFEFYMDVTGDIVFKPPFYNLDVLANKPVSWIQDIDIIDWGFSESESEVVTQLTMAGNFTGNMDYGLPSEEMTPYSSVTDYHLLRKYGWRTAPLNSEFMGDPQLMFYHGLDVLDRINSKRHHASITIPCRPELRLGFPVYVAPKDQMWYVNGISHNIAFGGRATTALTLTARREKFKAPRGHGVLTLKGPASPPSAATGKKASKVLGETASTTVTPKNYDKLTMQQLSTSQWTLEVGGAAQIPAIDYDPNKPETTAPYEALILRHPKTGKICGYPNMVMVYTRPMSSVTLAQWKNAQGKSKDALAKQRSAKDKPAIDANAAKQDAEEFNIALDDGYDTSQAKYNANRFSYGLNSAGVFIYAYEAKNALTQFALLPATNITIQSDGNTLKSKGVLAMNDHGSTMIRPVSDERGFEVVGHYRYGRAISLRDGRLILNADQKIVEKANPKNPNSTTNPPVTGNNLPANVTIPQALSGGLFETLTAQSQGLSTISTGYDNPADAIARLSPDGSDLQSAGIVDSNTKEASFVNTEPNFTDVAPLGSPQDTGVQGSVEASQLSRALTLAEMAVTGDLGVPDDDCLCTTGRSDLAFINVGYAIKTVNPANPATDIFNQTHLLGATGSSLINAKPLVVKPSDLKFDKIRDRVNKYLKDLYDALDGPHQQYEKALRGELTDFSQSEPAAKGNLLPTMDQQFGDFNPPFSSLNRDALGDPAAAGQAGSSAMTSLKTKFQQFGTDLQAKTKALALNKQLLDLSQQAAELRKQLSPPNANPFAPSTPPPNAAALNQQLDSIQQQISNVQTQIALLTSTSGGH